MPHRTTGIEDACELFEVGLRLVEQRFRRENPTATDVDVEERVRQWLLDRSSAPRGDSPGRSRPLKSINDVA